MLFQGVYTALVTPFKNGRIDWKAFETLLENQVAGKVAGVVPVGTTGESPTSPTKNTFRSSPAPLKSSTAAVRSSPEPERIQPKRQSTSPAKPKLPERMLHFR